MGIRDGLLRGGEVGNEVGNEDSEKAMGRMMGVEGMKFRT